MCGCYLAVLGDKLGRNAVSQELYQVVQAA